MLKKLVQTDRAVLIWTASQCRWDKVSALVRTTPRTDAYLDHIAHVDHIGYVLDHMDHIDDLLLIIDHLQSRSCSGRYDMSCRICLCKAQIRPKTHVLDHADRTAPTR